MNTYRVSIVTVVITAILLADSLFATEPPRLRHNPFSRPSTAVVAESFDRGIDRNSSPRSFELRATMISATKRLANVSGQVLHPGDEILGYQLLRVFENSAIFKKNDRQITIHVKPVLERDNDILTDN